MILASGTFLLIGFLQTATAPQTPANVAAEASVATASSLSDTPTPTDPKDLIDLGRKVNGLAGPDVQPWHVKATFEVFDDDGKSKDKGTFEEWWVSDKRYKRSYQSAMFSQVEYGTENGPLRAGSPKWPSGPLAFVRSELVDPLPSQNQMDNSAPSTIERTFGTTKLRCVYLAPKVPPKGDASRLLFPSYCFSPAKPILRSVTTFSNFNEILLNRIVIFRGRYLGGDINITRLGKEYANVHLELAEALGSPDRIDFSPPADAVVRPARKITISSTVAQANRLSSKAPTYPSEAKAKRIQGTVVIEATIDTSGYITSLQPVSGPVELQAAALDAVRQWVYKPYLLNGEPVEVHTMIDLTFSMW